MRQIGQFAQALVRAVSLRDSGQAGAAITEIDRVLSEAPSGLPDTLPNHALHDVASLLVLRGDLHVEAGQMTQARADYEAALAAYRRALDSKDRALPWDIQNRMDAVRERLEDDDWPDN